MWTLEEVAFNGKSMPSESSSDNSYEILSSSWERVLLVLLPASVTSSETPESCLAPS